MISRRFRKLSAALVFASLIADAPFAQADDWRTIVAPIYSKPEGQSYGRWAADWWQWALAIPKAENPLADTTGKQCLQRQVGEVWFLVGTSPFFNTSGKTVRACSIPAGKALFFPLINNASLAFLNDPPDQRTEQYVRSNAKCTQPAQITVSVDGRKILQPEQYFTGRWGSESPIFNVQLAPGNFVSDDQAVLPELLLSPGAEQGYYLFLYPLSPGKHTIKWVATGCTQGGSQDITYNLTVTKDNFAQAANGK